MGRAQGREADPEFTRACHAVTAGNPHLLRELIRELRREGVEPTAESAARVGELTPDAISRVALVRLARFPEPAVRLAEAVAIMGTGASVADASTLAAIDADVAASAASELAGADILAPGMPLVFEHPIVRDAVYEGIGAARRARLHARAAAQLAQRKAPPAEVAVHLMQAEPAADPAAVETLREAAAASLVRGAPEIAVEYLRRALAELPEPRVRRALLLELAEATTVSATVLELLEEALGLLEGAAALAEPLRSLAERALGEGAMLGRDRAPTARAHERGGAGRASTSAACRTPPASARAGG